MTTRHDDGARSPLESPALGSSLASLIAPCGDALRPAAPPPATTAPIGVTLSGGGFRATFAGLGVIRYLADAGLLHDLRYVSSVSGGSVANGMVATRWAQLRERGFTGAAVDELVIAPLVERVTNASLKSKLIRNVWRAVGPRNRTDVLAWAFDDWWFDEAQLESLDPGCRWIFNAANLTTGARFAFERDVVGDYVVGLAPTAGSKLRVAQARRRVGGGSGRLRTDEDRPGDVPVRRPRRAATARRRGLRQQRARSARQFEVPIGVHDLVERRRRVRDRRPRQDPDRARSHPRQFAAVPPEHVAADAMDDPTIRGLAEHAARRSPPSRLAARRPVRVGDRHRRADDQPVRLVRRNVS